MHQRIRVVKESNHHKYLGNLGIIVSKLLHGSSMEFQSGRTIVESRNYHRNDFLGPSVNTAAAHDRFILLPVCFQMRWIMRYGPEVHWDKRCTKKGFDVIIDFLHSPAGGALGHQLDRWHIPLPSGQQWHRERDTLWHNIYSASALSRC
jgi:hypothetical protein